MNPKIYVLSATLHTLDGERHKTLEAYASDREADDRHEYYIDCFCQLLADFEEDPDAFDKGMNDLFGTCGLRFEEVESYVLDLGIAEVIYVE